MDGLLMKYFVLKPAGTDGHAKASRTAMHAYAKAIRAENPALAAELVEWASREGAEAHGAGMWRVADWKAIAQRLGLAIQKFRHSPDLKNAGQLRATEGYADMCDAWIEYREAGGAVTPWESFPDHHRV